jgi:hypothetical protein
MHLPVDDQLLGRAAALGQAGGLEQRVERDELAAQAETRAAPSGPGRRTARRGARRGAGAALADNRPETGADRDQ